MLGGGKWTAQNKILSGTYINVVSKNSSGNSSTEANKNKNHSVLGKAVIGTMILDKSV